MDRSWIKADRLTQEYENGVREFIKFAIEHSNDINLISCPCWCCLNMIRINAEELEEHLMCNGFDDKYISWTKHGEIDSGTSGHSMESTRFWNETLITEDNDHVEDLPNDVEEDLRDCPKMFERLKDDAGTPLYNGCKNFTRLSAVLKFYNLKASNGWSDKSFTELLTLVNEMLSGDNVLPRRTYDAKQILSSIGLTHQKIHACPNECILFRNEYESFRECPKCNTPRYLKKESMPSNVLWYFPIIPRLRRLFRSLESAKKLTWHAEDRIMDGKLRHPADSPQWKKFDAEFEEFAAETRNICFALATDGMNPHGMQSSTRSTWPVILIIYNLPPWLCIKRKYMMLSLLISGPKQPGNDIDMYLSPLIDDLKLKHVETSYGRRSLIACTL